ncbi:hypothetical protein IQ07DRAFT_164693 [Pyrenochaeta sp. DS3sAY3a]|nr:hypothetical protein IQ07DRAFT_164693 [Pyrenochaeta sp. DS3sAY3a]
MADLTAWLEKNKELWTRVYDEVLAPDLAQEWKKREEQHAKELKQKDENQQILFSHISNEAVKNARLTKENEELREKVRVHQESAAFPVDRPAAEGKTTPVSTEEHRQLTERYDELRKKYQDVSQKVKYLERKNTVVMQKNKDMKDNVRAWQEYADRQSGKQKLEAELKATNGPSLPAARHSLDDRPHVPSSPVSIAALRTPKSLAEIGASPAPMSPLPHPATAGPFVPVMANRIPGEEPSSSRESTTPTPSVPVASINDRSSCNTCSTSTLPRPDEPVVPLGSDGKTHFDPAIPSSSQTTVDENVRATTQVTRAKFAESRSHSEIEDDMPVFVSARSLKRKRVQAPQSRYESLADRSSDGTPAKPFRVKEEPMSSPPLIADQLRRKETFDLDDPVPNILKTPRRLRKNASVYPNTASTLRHQRSNSAPCTQDANNEHAISNDIIPSKSFGFENADRELSNHHTDSQAIFQRYGPTEVERQPYVNLFPTKVDTSLEEQPSKRAKQIESRQAKRHSVLAESGEVPPVAEDSGLRLPPQLARLQINRKLNTSTAHQKPAENAQQAPKSGPAKIKLENLPTPPSSTSRYNQLSSTDTKQHVGKSRKSKTPDNRPIWSMKTSETRGSIQRTQPSPTKQARLRDKPVLELSLQDFKPNPAYNQGYTYAFSETVRKRGDRMCLPGCTNSQCCGSTFRTFAEAQAPMSMSQEEALLEDYLGDAYNDMQLTQMSFDERSELVLQARTKKLAKDAGKHREAYERRRTPPGFWRVDFPTTQEHQEDRERSIEQTKNIVQERWLEAQRRGGKWVFRDE